MPFQERQYLRAYRFLRVSFFFLPPLFPSLFRVSFYHEEEGEGYRGDETLPGTSFHSNLCIENDEYAWNEDEGRGEQFRQVRNRSNE